MSSKADRRKQLAESQARRRERLKQQGLVHVQGWVSPEQAAVIQAIMRGQAAAWPSQARAVTCQQAPAASARPPAGWLPTWDPRWGRVPDRYRAEELRVYRQKILNLLAEGHYPFDDIVEMVGDMDHFNPWTPAQVQQLLDGQAAGAPAEKAPEPDEAPAASRTRRKRGKAAAAG